MSRAAPYRDPQGRDAPGEAVAGPGCVYVGNVTPGRVVFLPGTGRRIRVVAQHDGSTTVERRGSPRTFQTTEGEQVSIKAPKKLEAIARGTVVRYTHPGGPR